MIRYGSVCSGIEAATVAWHPLGWQPAFVAETEPFPAHVLHQRLDAGRPLFMPAGKPRSYYRAMEQLPRVASLPNYGDLTQHDRWPHEPVDLLVGGTPCQSFSIAGLRGGLGDDRGNLALEFLMLADRLRPRWLVWENVPGVLSSNEGRDFGAILGGMAKLGYGFAYRVLDAQYIRALGFPYAVPQRRRRVFVAGYLGDWRRPAAVLFDRESLSGHPAPRREAIKGIASDDGARLSDGGGFVANSGIVSYCLAASGQQSLDAETETLIAIQEATTRENPNAGPGGKGFREDGGAFTLEARQVPQAVAYALKGEGFDASEDSTGRGTPLVTDGWSVRRLTPRECERLQGFPDDYTDVPWRGKDTAPDGPRYKALGNSMAVNVMRWIGERIAMVDAL